MENVKKTVLLVDDEPILLKTNCLLLQKSGLSVLVASDGLQALELAESCCDPIDLLLTDLRLPKMNGDVLASKLTGRYSELKVVFLTGSCCDCELEGLGRRHVVLRKPIDVEMLLETVFATLV